MAPAPETDPTLRAVATVHMLADRYGLITRSVAVAEGVPGGFAGLYRTLRAFEDSGALIRNYAVEGLGAAQFTLPGVVDSLRDRSGASPPAMAEAQEGPAIVLAAADPANPYGALLPWPEGPGAARPSRRAGAWVVLVDGRLAYHLDRAGRSLLTFPAPGDPPDPGWLASAAAALGRAVQGGTVPSKPLRKINGLDVLRPEADSDLEQAVAALAAVGFSATPQGLRMARLKR